MATDGQSLKYNPDFVNGLTQDELVGVVVHETLHCALGHHARMGNRDVEKWNVATDLVINQIVTDAAFSLPNGRLMPGEGKYADMPRGLSAEEYYRLLPQDPSGSGGGDPGGCGGVEKPGNGSPAEAANQKADWESAVCQAQMASKARGELPEGLGRAVGEVRDHGGRGMRKLEQKSAECHE